MKNQQNFKFLNLIIGIGAVVVMFLPVLILKDSDTSYTGLEVAFGKEFASLGSWASGQIAFNPLVLLAFLLPLIAGLIPMFAKNGFLFSMIIYVIGAVFIFMIPDFTTVTVTVLGNVNEINVEWTYGIGLILAASFSIFGALFSLFSAFRRN